MHEMSLAESILQIVEETAARQDFRRVTEVRLEIGALSGVEVDALSFCLDVVLKGSVADGARIELERVPAIAWAAAKR
jgi:hydrogenase nickel incorporation protein HypA/HybF